MGEKGKDMRAASKTHGFFFSPKNKKCEANNVKCKLLLNPDSGYINVSFSIFIHVSSGL